MPKARMMLLAAAATCLAAGTTAAGAATKTIKIGDNWFVRSGGAIPTVRVVENSTVTWRWVGDSRHDIRARSVPSGEKKPRFRATARSTGTFKRKVTVPGTYRLYCSIHEYDRQEMVLRVRAR